MKTTRWYEKDVSGQWCIYDAPYSSEALSVSMVNDIAYYRAHFRMLPLEGHECPKFYREA